MVTLWIAAFVARKYEQMRVSGSALCWQRWRKLQAAFKTGFLCSRLVASMVVDSLLTLFFCVYKKRVTDQDWRNTLEWAS